MDNFSVLSWNACGLAAHVDYLIIFLLNSNISPDIICIQETHLVVDSVGIPGYTGIFKHRVNRRGGGVAIFVKSNLVFTAILIQDLEAVGVQILSDNGFSITCLTVYSPPTVKLKLETLLEKLGDSTIITGDFNAKNTLWGSQNTDRKGNYLENTFANVNLICLNNKEGTRINNNGTLSCLDLVYATPNLASRCSFSVCQTPWGVTICQS